VITREAYLAFIGVREGSARAEVYRGLRGELPESARVFWDGRPGDIATGIQHVGRTERSIARVSPVLHRFLNKDIARMRAASSLEEQGEIARAVFDRLPVRAVLALIFNPLSGRVILRDPVYYGEGRRSAAEYLRGRVTSTLRRHRFDDCFILSLFLNGDLKHSRSMPVGLGVDDYPVVQSRLDRIRFERSCVIDYLGAQRPEQFDAFSLSDLGGYLTIAEFGTLLEHVERTSRSGSRVCIREYISAPTERAPWPEGLARLPELERRLDASDRSVGCTFVCAVKSAPSANAEN
jgi:S-adenosylmethionine-diacylglycerol 3-amino-3-carboxypropyl transferase